MLEIIGGSATNADGTPFTGKLSINPVPIMAGRSRVLKNCALDWR